MTVTRVVVITILAVVACGRGGDSPDTNGSAGSGSARISARPLRGLRPPNPECEAVGEALASLDLGNYAPSDRRAMRVAAIRAMCEAERLSPAEVACVLAKKTKDELAACPKPLLVKHLTQAQIDAKGGVLGRACTEYIVLLEHYVACPAVPASAKQGIRDVIETMKDAWRQAGVGSAGGSGVYDDACKQGTDAIKTAMTQMGC